MSEKIFSTNGHKRAVLYARVSTDEQAEKGYSLPSQVAACRKYAEQSFAIVGDQYFDLKAGKVVPSPNENTVPAYVDDYTGTKLDRPSLNEVRAMIYRKEVDAVIVHASDRLSRKLAHVLVLREEFQRAGIELHFVNRGKSEDTPESRMTENIEGVFNEYWREKIVEAARRGMAGKAKSGKVVETGHPPYGYIFSGKGNLVIIETEAEVVSSIFQWFTIGKTLDEAPLSIHRICQELAKLGIKTPGETKKYRTRKRSSCQWNTSTIYSILTSETYLGIWRWGRYIGHGHRNGKRPIDEQIAVSVPAVVDLATWQRAQSRLDYNRQMCPRNNTKNTYLLRGLVKCGCGFRMSGAQRDARLYYRCPAHFHRGKHEHDCKEKSIRCDLLDHLAWVYINEIFSDEERFEQKLREAQRLEQQATKPKRRELDATEAKIAETEADARKLADDIHDAPKGGLMERTLKEKATALDRQYLGLCQHRDELVADLQKNALNDDDVAAFLEFRRDVEAGLKGATSDDKRFMLERLQVQVLIKSRKAKFTCRIAHERVFDLDSANGTEIKTPNWITFEQEYDLDEVARAFFAKVALPNRLQCPNESANIYIIV